MNKALLLDLSNIPPHLANRYVDRLCKSVEERILFDAHPLDPAINVLENRWTQVLASRLKDVLDGLAAVFGIEHLAKARRASSPSPFPDDDECRELEQTVSQHPDGSLPYDLYMRLVDCLLLRYAPMPVLGDRVKREAVRDFIVGRYRAQAQRRTMAMPRDLPHWIESLPTDLKNAVAQGYLAPADVARVKVAQDNGLRLLTQTTESMRSRLKSVVLQAERQRLAQGARNFRPVLSTLEQALRDADEDLNRDWRRVAVTETAINAHDGYLLAMPDGERVKWIAHPGACRYCQSQHGSIFTVRHQAVDDDRQSVWPGKTTMNVGRSISPKKRLPDGSLVDREAHELVVPAIPAHPHCRCIWVHEAVSANS